MANLLYEKAQAAFLKGEIDWVNDTVKVILVDTALYTYDSINDQYLSDVPAGARVATGALTSKTVSDIGAVDAADLVYAVVSGASVEAIVLYKDTGVEATSQLIMYSDTLAGLPFTPGGGSVTIVWDASGIFGL